MTSHDVVARIRSLLRAQAPAPSPSRRRRGPKVGHAGTLDPDATGILVVCVGRATRLVPFLQASRKTYEARMRLGVTTTTLDAAGEVIAERDASKVDEPLLCEVLKGLLGEIEQVPPMVSAVKVGGERLYAKARRGETVERAPRRVSIHDLVLEDFEPGPRAEASFLVTCSPGTYIRTLAADIGEALGVGAHLVRLRRLAAGRFTLDDAHALDEVERLAGESGLAHVMIAMAQAVADYPHIVVGAGEGSAIRHGRPLPPTGKDGPVAVLDSDGALLAMVEDRKGAARPLVVVAPAGADVRE